LSARSSPAGSDEATHLAVRVKLLPTARDSLIVVRAVARVQPFADALGPPRRLKPRLPTGSIVQLHEESIVIRVRATATGLCESCDARETKSGGRWSFGLGRASEHGKILTAVQNSMRGATCTYRVMQVSAIPLARSSNVAGSTCFQLLPAPSNPHPPT
jgi:hypothetical protein